MGTDTTRPASLCPEGRYTRLPDQLIIELTPREHQLVHALLSYRWTDDAPIYPYVGTLAARLGCSKRTIQRTLRSLERKGYIVTVARYRDESEDGAHHGQTSSVYAPGPMLLPLLPRDRDEDARPAQQERQAPMTPMPYTKKHGNYRTEKRDRNRQYTPPSDGDFLMTSRGYRLRE